jgi:uncharacterized protein
MPRLINGDKGIATAIPFPTVANDGLALFEIALVGINARIVKAIFSFPGGRRFHFTDPNGNELAVWSDAE